MHRLLGESEIIDRRRDACLISTLPLHPFVVLSHPFPNCRAVLIVRIKIYKNKVTGNLRSCSGVQKCRHNGYNTRLQVCLLGLVGRGSTLLLLESRADLALPAAGAKPCHARTTNKPTRAPTRGWRLSLKGLGGLRRTAASCPNQIKPS